VQKHSKLFQTPMTHYKVRKFCRGSTQRVEKQESGLRNLRICGRVTLYLRNGTS